MAQVENQVKLFSLDEQLHLLAYIANTMKSRASSTVLPVTKGQTKRHAGGLTGDFYMADDFDETPDCFKEYV
ncbi:MAG: DUF2281 domain-containing protein [Treponema sp.]|nr:DUF2281 domain-containing protein [Treponema sp.]